MGKLWSSLASPSRRLLFCGGLGVAAALAIAGLPRDRATRPWTSEQRAIAADGAAPAAAESAPSDPPLPDRLSETGLYLPGTGTIAPDALLYSPQYPLWTDGATKRRWIALPKGTSIDGSRPDAWVFPVGTRFWKEFSFGRDRVETRFIERLPSGRYRYATYVWDAKLGDAVLASAEGRSGAVAIGRGVRHDVPSREDCRACHEGRRVPVLGFGALQLSSDRDPRAPHGEPRPEGAVDLGDLVRRGLLVGLPPALVARPPRIVASSEAARAAAGYLFGNCAGCHNEGGPLASLGLDLDQSVLDLDGQARLERTAIGRPGRFRIPDAATSLRIAAGRPDLSAVAFRMRSRDPREQMPPLGTKVVDEEALRLIERWIAQDLPDFHDVSSE